MERFSVRKPLTVFVAVLAILILGVVAFTKMTPDLLPNMDFPYVVIVTTYPGASPETVEAEVTRPMEQSMSTLEHIKSVQSTSSENFSLVMLEFEDSVNMDTVGVDIQQNLTALSGAWDESVGTPFMLKINPSLLPVEAAAVSMEGMDTVELSDFVDNTLLPQLEGVPGVARITTMGSVTRQVHVVIDEGLIADINERIAGSVNEKLDDAAAELQDTKQELEDAKRELENAQDELAGGQSSLINQTSEAEAALNQQQIELLEGRIELRSQLLDVTQSKTELQTTLDVLLPLQERLSGALDTLSGAESRVEAFTAASSRMDAADAALGAFEEEIDAIGNSDLPDEEKAERIAELTGSDEYLAAREEAAQAEAALTELGSSRYTVSADIAAAGTGAAMAQAELSAIDAALSAMDQTRESLPGTVAELSAGLSAAEASEEMLSDTITQLDDGEIQLSEAMSTLSGAKSAGLLQLADAAAQITMNAGTVDSALEQVDSGLESIEDSRESALSGADISDSITLSTVSSILTAQNFSMPAGTVKQDGITYMVSVGDEMTDPEELKGLLLFDTGEDAIGPVYLSDVAAVFVTDNSDETYARLDGENGVILTFEKQSNAATAEVTEGIGTRFSELERKYDGLHFVPLMDQGEYIHIIIRSILQSLLYGAVFAIIVLLLFLRDIRPTVITLISIPVSVVFAFVLMYFTGVTLNMISLSGLAVSVGMLVDNSIVVIENIYRLRSRGATAIQAAVQGARQVAGAITASTLTTVCVFVPIVFVEGITKKLFTDLALTLTFSLMASLVIALTLVPALAKGMLRERREKKPIGERRFIRGYRRFIAWSLGHRWIVLLTAAALLTGSVAGGLSKGFSFMPDIDMNTVDLTITMPEGASRDEAAAWADEALSRIGAMEQVETVGAMMGGTSLLSLSESYDVTAYVTLPEGESGKAAGQEIIELCADLPVTITADSQMMNAEMLTGSGFSVNVFANDMEDLQSAARRIADALAEVEGLEDIDDGLEDAQDALHIAIDKNAAMEKGYTVAQVYMEISAALQSSAGSIRMDMGDVTADVLIDADQALSPEELMDIALDRTNADGEKETFPLRDIASLEDTVSLASIRRTDQRRYVTVSAAVSEGYNVTLVSEAARQVIDGMSLPVGVSYTYDGENESVMEAVEQLLLMLLLGMVLVYFIMVAQFQSLKSPFIVMFTIPLAFTGGFMALLLCGMDISILALIGFVMLTGVIVNNGIVLVDCVNQLRAGGMERREALIEAGATRLRPILMTSLTTVLGLAVMAMGADPGTALMQPVAVVSIGGLLYATLMTLVVVPCIYDLVNRKDLKIIRDEDMEFSES